MTLGLILWSLCTVCSIAIAYGLGYERGQDFVRAEMASKAQLGTLESALVAASVPKKRRRKKRAV